MLAFAIAAATEGAEQHNELPLSPVMFGVISLGVFAALLGFTWFFRSTASKH